MQSEHCSHACGRGVQADRAEAWAEGEAASPAPGGGRERAKANTSLQLRPKAFQALLPRCSMAGTPGLVNMVNWVPPLEANRAGQQVRL